jgi:predicted component of type VI protein secretion system
LAEVAGQLVAAREELRVAEEQYLHFADAAEEARVRALVAEDGLAEREHREAVRHAAAMDRHRAEVADRIARLEREQDECLDGMLEEGLES